jgi:hypothetical protein
MMHEISGLEPECPECHAREADRIYTVPGVKIESSYFHHGLGRKIRSSREVRGESERVRERYFEMTGGEHTTRVPERRDPEDPDSPVVWADKTFKRQGVDIGELHPVEYVPEKLSNPTSAFDEGKTLEESEAALKRELG